MRNLICHRFLKLETGNLKLSQFFAVLILSVAFIVLSAENADGQATGTPPFGSFAGGPDVINLADINVHWDFPVFARAGRGIPFNYTLSFDNSVWRVVTDGSGNQSWQPPLNGVFGWTRQTDAVTGYVTYTASVVGCGTIYSNWVYHDQRGTAHSFPTSLSQTTLAVSNPAGCGGWPSGASGIASDGSGFKITVYSTPSATVVRPTGGYISPPLQNPYGAASISDANGNYISTNDGLAFNDTLGADAQGHNVMTISAGWAPYPNSFTYQASGGSKQITISYTTMNLQTSFGCTGIAEYGYNGVPMITAINYPDGSSYQFSYEPTPGNPVNTTGRLAQVTLPTGGTISYSYWGGAGSLHGQFCDGTTAAFHRTVNDGSNTFQTDFWIAQNADGTTATHIDTFTGSQYDETVVTFSGGLETQRQIYQGPAPPTTGGTLKEAVLTCYNGNFTNCPTATITPPITYKVRYTTLDGTTSRHDDSFNSYGLVTGTTDYDFGYALLGSTQITYATNLGDIVNRPTSVVVQDASGNVKAQTNYVYDDYSVYGLVITSSYTPTVPNHGSLLQSQRGNLTSVSQWVSGPTTQGTQGSVYLTKHLTYFDTGVLSSTIDVNGAVTTYNYPTNDPNLTTCGFTFPNSVSAPAVGGITLTTSNTYNCDGGVVVSTTDPNGNPRTVTTWDANFWRPTQVKDELLNATNISYISATATESTFNFNGGNSTVDTRTTLDGLGRTHIVQQKQSPTATNYDSVETDYDSYGRPSRQTIPYVAAAGLTNSSAAATATTYDALSRTAQVTAADGLGIVNYTYTNNDVLIEIKPAPTVPVTENTKRHQYEYDALGRLTSVCEVTGGTGSNACGQSNAETGYLTKYTYDAAGRLTGVAQNAQTGGTQQTRSFTYDGLGRMLSEGNPELGTTSYVYDSSTGSCAWTSTGDLVAKHDPAGNTSCYVSDLLHRVTSIGYYDGPYQNTTPAKFFVYDAATVTINGAQISIANPKGRLVRAYTEFRPYTAVTADEAFSYSARGETTDMYEWTPHAGSTYHLTQTYWEHGAPKVLNSGLAGLPTITYGGTIGSTIGLDGEGRFTQVTAASGQNPVTGATYVTGGSTQPIGALTDVNFGSLDHDHFDFDNNTGRLTKYTFNVGSPNQTDVGQLTWNANGSLQQLQITDGITTANSQTCNYTHDDLGRIASANCGAVQNQSFSYDPFGNIKKNAISGVGNFTVNYDQTTNRVQNAAYSYDNDGCLLNDGTGGGYQYTWDAEGKMLSVTTGGSTVNLIYDALGRMVEQQRGSSYTQVVYGPGGGKLALMNGQTLAKAFIPLLGGATAVYNSSGLAYYRHTDWLGSSRLASTPSRTVYYDVAYAPYGENYGGTGTTDLSFTGQNQDTASGLYDFMFREYSPGQGRWISPDPAGLTAVSLTNPQSWNRYAYVANNPLALIDPLGLYTDGNPPPPPNPLPTSLDPFSLYGLPGFGQRNYLDDLLLALDDTGYTIHVTVSAAKQKVCQYVPDGRTSGISAASGPGVGVTSGFERVVNYNTGEISGFIFLGGQAGLHGVGSVSLNGGYIWGLGNSNANYSGNFSSAAFSGTVVGGSISTSSAGINHPATNLMTPTVVGLNASVSYLGLPVSATVSATNYSDPMPAGNLLSLGSVGNSISSPEDFYVYMHDLLLMGLNYVCK